DDRPWSLPVCLAVPAGLEAVIREEAEERGIGPLVPIDPGVPLSPSLLRCPLGTPPWGVLAALRCAYGPFIEAGEGSPLWLEGPDGAAPALGALLSNSEVLRHWRGWIDTQEEVLRYRFSLEGPSSSREVFQRLLRSVRQSCSPLHLWDSPSNY